MVYLSAKQLVAVNLKALSGTGESTIIRNAEGLSSIETLHKQGFFDKEAYPSIQKKIGIVFIKIINLHPFEDGNKRTAVLAATIMAKLNGYALTFTNKEIESLALRVAATDDIELDYEQVYSQFKVHLTKISKSN
ncbi:type II toxin-antitoxin system death-on-curing family toxin [Levilactobacillus andaensis]|uniref:type II toxin-antitoxin system death-on-curing family toxin n=1 Tax=Levilactobacillus andaensis TaxID=2799570 RepID=UPI00194324FD|nr:type II toxin-antitoxin system death-on-curing family toxin [Levilactobacillus andaensis]